jgi:hypothetical protein
VYDVRVTADLGGYSMPSGLELNGVPGRGSLPEREVRSAGRDREFLIREGREDREAKELR